MAPTLLEPTGGKPPGHLAKAKWAQKLGTKLLRTKLQLTQHALGLKARRISCPDPPKRGRLTMTCEIGRGKGLQSKPAILQGRWH